MQNWHEAGADPGIFHRRRPESRDDHIINSGQIKLFCEQRRKGALQNIYIVENAGIYTVD